MERLNVLIFAVSGKGGDVLGPLAWWGREAGSGLGGQGYASMREAPVREIICYSLVRDIP